MSITTTILLLHLWCKERYMLHWFEMVCIEEVDDCDPKKGFDKCITKVSKSLRDKGF